MLFSSLSSALEEAVADVAEDVEEDAGEDGTLLPARTSYVSHFYIEIAS